MKLMVLALVLAVGCSDEEPPIRADGSGVDAGRDTGFRDGGNDGSVPDTGDLRDGAPEDGAARDTPLDAGSGPTAVDISDPMMGPRQGHAVGFVGDGRVLFVGGTGEADTPSQTWAFDPATTRWSRLGDLPAPHVGASSIVLPDGRMLISGGIPSQFALMSNDGIFVFDLETSTWSPYGTMTEVRGGHTVYMLSRGPDAGKIVMFGGSRRSSTGATILTTFELYDPETQVSTPIPSASFPSPRASYFHFELDDGRIVIGGGYTNPGDPSGSAIDEILVYDPMTHTVSTSPATLPEAHLLRLVGELPDGRALIFPGLYSSRAIRAMDPDTFEFTRLGEVQDGYISYGTAFVPSSQVYLFGGYQDRVIHDNVLHYNPATNEWNVIEDILPYELGGVRPTALPDGRVVLVGGQTTRGFIVGETTLFIP